MDELVTQALARWPNVPHCHDWLGLDARGDWYLRDDATQAQGPFPAPKGSRLEHAGLIGFIARNYAADEAGQWFFQNGPQRVYVSLEAAPYVLRLQPDGRCVTHTGAPATVHACWLDEEGRLFAETSAGFGLVHTQDVLAAAQALEDGQWPEPQTLAFAEMPARFGYVLSPR